jgi:hypothetical protein
MSRAARAGGGKPFKAAAPAMEAAVPLQSRGAIVFTGLSFLFTGFAFSYVDRSRGGFGVFCALWLLWAVLGFGAGVLNQRQGETAGRRQWRGMALFGGVLALFPGFVMYPFARWVCLVLMIVVGARAAHMRLRRDLYLTLTVVFTVCFLTTTHYAADWSLWFYLGPAWLCAGLALAWLHADGVDISRWAKLSMTTGFVAVSFAIAACLFLFAPRPPVVGFGFLPGGDVPGLYDPPLGNPDAGRAELRKPPRGGAGNGTGLPDGNGGWGESSRGRAGQGDGRPPPSRTPPSPWDRMLDSMRDAGRDPHAPQWQRNAINGALDAAQAWRRWWKGQGSAGGAAGGMAGQGDQPGTALQAQEVSAGAGTGPSLADLLLWLAAALAAWLLWRSRYRWGTRVALGLAWALSRWWPARSMQLSARAMGWCLRGRRHVPRAGQSVREHWSSAPGLAPLARQWMERALETYCAMRFGGLPATRERALRMREEVLGAADVMGGAAPELGR